MIFFLQKRIFSFDLNKLIFLLTFFQLQYLPFLLVFLFEILLARLNKSFSLNKLFDSNHTESLQSTLYDNLICLKTDADWERLMRYTDVLPFSPRLVVHTHTFNECFIGNSKRLVRIAFAMLTYTHTRTSDLCLSFYTWWITAAAAVATKWNISVQEMEQNKWRDRKKMLHERSSHTGNVKLYGKLNEYPFVW